MEISGEIDEVQRGSMVTNCAIAFFMDEVNVRLGTLQILILYKL